MFWKSLMCCFGADDLELQMDRCERMLNRHAYFLGPTKSKYSNPSKLQDRVDACEKVLFEHELKLVLYNRILAQQDFQLDSQAQIIYTQEKRIHELDSHLNEYLKLNKTYANILHQASDSPTAKSRPSKRRCLN